uniref:Uncharacterized protein n=1 Tax=Pyramimonas obovata TaxID=1411642 RepID=A0A7S0RH78_9CHLO|eukprot:CAMPEP_0118949308 /NCGR_PEP_ID=MMETSP1169-20130426/49396_1 /TAXON_ID=36882 /ORGANISM="Pyramimonas obovata, Strain CCMP722" /LENGTH=133 /DNA_ID=CAMNT_0006895913 /DNA_START=493 /DNA_END=894 /DNA_ORIENTATION=+
MAEQMQARSYARQLLPQQRVALVAVGIVRVPHAEGRPVGYQNVHTCRNRRQLFPQSLPAWQLEPGPVRGLPGYAVDSELATALLYDCLLVIEEHSVGEVLLHVRTAAASIRVHRIEDVVVATHDELMRIWKLP